MWIRRNIFLINGYSFGDRLLEDVMFEVEFKDKEVLRVKVDEDSKDYFKDLNTKNS